MIPHASLAVSEARSKLWQGHGQLHWRLRAGRAIHLSGDAEKNGNLAIGSTGNEES